MTEAPPDSAPMRLYLQHLKPSEDGTQLLVFRIAAGRAEARLKSPRAGVEVGKTYSAELGIEETLEMGANVRASDERAYRVATEDSTTTLVGQVDSVDDDGLVYFRLGADALVMIEIAPAPPAVGSWLRIDLPPSSIDIYLTG